MRRFQALAVAVAVALGVVAGVSGSRGSGAAAETLVGVTGNVARFHSQTGQDSQVVQAFLGWGQGLTYGAKFTVLFATLGPIPMIHLGTAAKNGREAITPGDIAAGRGDAYLIALNQAILAWGRGIYIRPMAEMNNPGTLYAGYDKNGGPRDAAHSPAAYRKAFARIFVILHGGSLGQVNAKLRALKLPGLTGTPELGENEFPRLRVVWSPLAGGSPRVAGNAPAAYYPGRSYVDVEGGDIYDESLTDNAPWSDLEALYRTARSHGKPFSVPEWGLFGIDDPAFVLHMCNFLKDRAVTENEVFFNAKPGSVFDLGPKPKSRAAYRNCITPLAGELPSWASGTTTRVVALSLTPDQESGDAPLTVQFAVAARLSVPVQAWQVLYGDGRQASGSGPPPAQLQHVYAQDGGYEATLVVFPSPPFTTENARFLASANVTVGAGTPLVSFQPTPPNGKAPLKVVFRTVTALPAGVTGWELVYGDGTALKRSGPVPGFAGHTYTAAGVYVAILILDSGAGRFVTSADVTVRGAGAGTVPPAAATTTGRVLVNGQLFTGGTIPYGAKVGVTKGRLKLTTDVGTLTVYGSGVTAIFFLVRGTDRGKPVVELKMTEGDFSVCNKRKSSVHSATKPPTKTVRRLFTTGKGKFRTRGRYAAAIARGTFWLTADRCDGTLVQVKQGRVEVRDGPKRKTVQVRAGKSYLAKKP